VSRPWRPTTHVRPSSREGSPNPAGVRWRADRRPTSWLWSTAPSAALIAPSSPMRRRRRPARLCAHRRRGDGRRSTRDHWQSPGAGDPRRSWNALASTPGRYRSVRDQRFVRAPMRLAASASSASTLRGSTSIRRDRDGHVARAPAFSRTTWRRELARSAPSSGIAHLPVHRPGGQGLALLIENPSC